jgi:hypothetical protein
MGHFQIVMAAVSFAMAYGGAFGAEQVLDRLVPSLEAEQATPLATPTEESAASEDVTP